MRSEFRRRANTDWDLKRGRRAWEPCPRPRPQRRVATRQPRYVPDSPPRGRPPGYLPVPRPGTSQQSAGPLSSAHDYYRHLSPPAPSPASSTPPSFHPSRSPIPLAPGPSGAAGPSGKILSLRPYPQRPSDREGKFLRFRSVWPTPRCFRRARSARPPRRRPPPWRRGRPTPAGPAPAALRSRPSAPRARGIKPPHPLPTQPRFRNFPLPFLPNLRYSPWPNSYSTPPNSPLSQSSVPLLLTLFRSVPLSFLRFRSHPQFLRPVPYSNPDPFP